ncbi:hypothetical protein [Paenibacillus sp. GCM10027626]|uniref:hypothetical protein n=1 Tax=Paenibacillus sp. GCM10027626 TaxID=3273411 RepID=UPI003637F77A
MNFNQDIDIWIQFFKDNWVMLLIALVVLFLVIKIVKTVVKWLIVAVIIIGVVVYSGYTLDDLKDIGTKAIETVKQEVVSTMAGEVKDAKYTTNKDGSFTVTTKNLELTGMPGDRKVKVSFQGTPAIEMKIDDTIRNLIDQAKSNG